MAEHIYIKFYGIYNLISSTHLREAEAVFSDWDKYIKDVDINSDLFGFVRCRFRSTFVSLQN